MLCFETSFLRCFAVSYVFVKNIALVSSSHCWEDWDSASYGLK